MTTPTFEPTWCRSKSKPSPMLQPDSCDPRKSRLTYPLLGLLLSMLLVVLLSGCCPQPAAVYVKPTPYPLPDSSLMRPPLNSDLAERLLSPSSSAKSD